MGRIAREQIVQHLVADGLLVVLVPPHDDDFMGFGPPAPGHRSISDDPVGQVPGNGVEPSRWRPSWELTLPPRAPAGAWSQLRSLASHRIDVSPSGS